MWRSLSMIPIYYWGMSSLDPFAGNYPSPHYIRYWDSHSYYHSDHYSALFLLTAIYSIGRLFIIAIIPLGFHSIFYRRLFIFLHYSLALSILFRGVIFFLPTPMFHHLYQIIIHRPIILHAWLLFFLILFLWFSISINWQLNISSSYPISHYWSPNFFSIIIHYSFPYSNYRLSIMLLQFLINYFIMPLFNWDGNKPIAEIVKIRLCIIPISNHGLYSIYYHHPLSHYHYLLASLIPHSSSFLNIHGLNYFGINYWSIRSSFN